MDQDDISGTPPGTDPSSVPIPPGRTPSDADFNAEPSLLYAVIGGSLVALVLAILWGLITVAAESQYGIMAIAIGLVTGSAVRYFGRGETTLFGAVGAFLSLASCLVGNLLSVYGFIAKNNSLSIFQALFQVDLSRVLSALPETFNAMDLVFYGIAAFEGYRFSFIPTAEGGRAEATLFGPLMKPALARFRKPLLVLGGLLALGGIYGLQSLASGPMTLTYESGAPRESGALRSGKPHGLWTYYYESGAVQSKMNFREGEADGEASWWNSDGKLTREGAWWQGMEHGEWKFYDDNGTVVAKGRFAYGRQVGEWEYRHPNKERSKVCRYVLGALDGESVSWHPNGIMSEQGRYQDGKKTGVWRTWDSGGLPCCEYRYEGDTELVVECRAADRELTVKDGSGEFVSYHPDGQLKEKGSVKDGRKTGIWLAFHPNGKMNIQSRWDGDTRSVLAAWDEKGVPLVENGNGTYVVTGDAGKVLVKGNYKNGLQDGEWSLYYEDTGTVMQVQEYAGGLSDGKYLGYYESGAMQCQGLVRKDQREGEWIWYHENGEVSSRVTLIAGKKDGDQIFYNSQGKKVREETYKAGAIVAERDLSKPAPVPDRTN
jgi:antitoxin component YwqK of YwqJK toxin-antitoxin module